MNTHTRTTSSWTCSPLTLPYELELGLDLEIVLDGHVGFLHVVFHFHNAVNKAGLMGIQCFRTEYVVDVGENLD